MLSRDESSGMNFDVCSRVSDGSFSRSRHRSVCDNERRSSSPIIIPRKASMNISIPMVNVKRASSSLRNIRSIHWVDPVQTVRIRCLISRWVKQRPITIKMRTFSLPIIIQRSAHVLVHWQKPLRSCSLNHHRWRRDRTEHWSHSWNRWKSAQQHLSCNPLGFLKPFIRTVWLIQNRMNTSWTCCNYSLIRNSSLYLCVCFVYSIN